MSITNDPTAVGLIDRQRAYIDGLRDLADALERCPEAMSYSPVYVPHYVDSPEALRRVRRAIGGLFRKRESALDDLALDRQFGPHTLALLVSREQVCERVQTGTKTVTREVPIEEPVPPATRTVTEEIPVYEWRCSGSLTEAE